MHNNRGVQTNLLNEGIVWSSVRCVSDSTLNTTSIVIASNTGGGVILVIPYGNLGIISGLSTCSERNSLTSCSSSHFIPTTTSCTSGSNTAVLSKRSQSYESTTYNKNYVYYVYKKDSFLPRHTSWGVV